MIPLLKVIVRQLYYRFFNSVFSFYKIKGYYLWKHNFFRFCVRNRLPDCYKLAINRKNDNNVTIFWHEVTVKFFWGCFVSLVKFSYWSKFNVNTITGSRIKTIFFYKGLTKNQEIGNTHVWGLPNIWRLEQVRNTKFDTNISNKILLNATKSQGYGFYCFCVIKGKPTGRGGG